jgi:predicted RNA-binding protein YlxR (DUF448 family)
MAERTCIICRSVAEKWTLLRFSAKGSALVVDREQANPGRGAYVHEQVNCLSRMGQPARWERALKLGEKALEPTTVIALGRELLSEAQKGQMGPETSEMPPQPRARKGRKVRL